MGRPDDELAQLRQELTELSDQHAILRGLYDSLTDEHDRCMREWDRLDRSDRAVRRLVTSAETDARRDGHQVGQVSTAELRRALEGRQP